MKHHVRLGDFKEQVCVCGRQGPRTGYADTGCVADKHSGSCDGVNARLHIAQNAGIAATRLLVLLSFLH